MTPENPKVNANQKRPASVAKVYWWLCGCGEWNPAPALQTPDNQIQCTACRKILKWKEVGETA